MFRPIAPLLMLAQVAVVTNANAQAPESDSLVKEGVELRRTGRDAEALAVFERALAIDGSPRTRAQVALAEEALGLWVEAERDLTSALAAGHDDWFVQRRGKLQSALEAIRDRLATLDVETSTPGAELWVNGARAGVVPLSAPIRVVSGTITMEVRAAGFEPQTRTIHIAPQTRAREVMDLARVTPPAPERAATPSVLVPAADVEQARPPSSAFRESPVERGSSLRTAAWVSLGASVALLAGAGAALLIRDSKAVTYNTDSVCFYGGLTRDQRCGGYRDAVSTAQTVAVIGFEAAAAAVGLSVVLFSLAAKPSAPRVGNAQCTVGLGLACGGRL